MSRRLALGAGLMLGLVSLGACDQELPTDIGGEHLPESALRTYEILLQGDEFLAADTLVRGFGTSNLSSVLLVAEDYGGVLDSHGLVEFGQFPSEITYVDSVGAKTDTVEYFTGGRIVLRVDTVGLRLDTLGTDTTIVFEMHALAESFDPRTATWTARSAESGDTTYWTTPGGTPGDLIGTGSWTRSDTIARDSIVFLVDSATVAAWAADPERPGILLTTTTVGARANVLVPRLELSAHLKNADTTRTVSAVVQGQTYVFDPPPPAPLDELRLGDRSAWRSFLTFLPGLDTTTVACPGEPVGCAFRLSEVTVNRAELRLRTLPVDEVYRPRGNFSIEARPVLGADLPLERAPLADTTGSFRLTPAHFEGTADSLVTISVTRFVRGLLGAGADTTLTERNRTVALLTAPEPISFGIVRFGSLGTDAAAPVLRLIVTLPPREEED